MASKNDYLKEQIKHIDIKSHNVVQLVDAMESMAYGMPAYKLNGKPLVYFAGHKNHIGFYALPTRS